MKPETIKTLSNTAATIEAAAQELDRSEQPCDHCGTVRKTNWNEFQMGQELDAIVRKLRGFAKKLAEPPDAEVALDQWIAWESNHGQAKPNIRRKDEPRLGFHKSRPATEREVLAELERRKTGHRTQHAQTALPE